MTTSSPRTRQRTSFYGQVADPGTDHQYWGPAETNPTTRPSYAVTSSCPGSDLTGQASAALAASSIVFKTSDPKYSAQLLSQAESLYSFADSYLRQLRELHHFRGGLLQLVQRLLEPARRRGDLAVQGDRHGQLAVGGGDRLRQPAAGPAVHPARVQLDGELGRRQLRRLHLDGPAHRPAAVPHRRRGQPGLVDHRVRRHRRSATHRAARRS